MTRLNRSNRRAVLALLGAGLTGLTPIAVAQNSSTWPTKPIRVVVTFPAGGLLDVVTRMLAQRLAEVFQQPVIVENRPGANGNIGGQQVAKSAADGYTLLATSADMVAVNPHLYKMGFDPAKDLQPITQIARVSMMIVARPQYPANDAKEMVAHLKARPEQSYGTPGVGSSPHLVAETLRLETGARINHVPYKGLGAALTDLLGGQIDWVVDAGVSLPYLREGRLKLLAIAGKSRHSEFPNVPTLTESGLPGFDSDTTFVMMAPAGTPKPIIDRINAEVVRLLRSDGFTERLNALSLSAVADSPTEAQTSLRADHARLGQVIAKAGIKAE